MTESGAGPDPACGKAIAYHEQVDHRFRVISKENSGHRHAEPVVQPETGASFCIERPCNLNDALSDAHILPLRRHTYARAPSHLACTMSGLTDDRGG